MKEFRELLRALIEKRDLDREDAADAIGAMMDERWSAPQAAAFLTALAAKGECESEVVGAAHAMRARGVRVEHDLPLVVDTCGTGGDGSHTINVSTAAAFVVAGCGVPVAKHGNRAASSACGSADVLETSGVPIDASPEQAAANLRDKRFAFLFAPLYHPAAKAVGPIRRELGVRTLFNVLGPLANPARATHQVVGVASPAHLELVGRALQGLGVKAAAVVHAHSGIDEVAGDVPTEVFQFDSSGARRWTLDPAEFGVRAPADAVAGGSPAENAAALYAILAGESSPRSDVIALNAALVLAVAERANGLAEGLAQARAALANGAALEVFERLRRPTQLEPA